MESSGSLVPSNLPTSEGSVNNGTTDEGYQSTQTRPLMLKTLLPSFTSYVEREGGVGCGNFNPAERYRFRVLREAIISEDWFFVVLLQLYALSSVDKATLSAYARLDLTMRGFGVMTDLLQDSPKPQQKHQAYLASLPAPLPNALEKLPLYHLLVEQVASFMAHGCKVGVR
jgi:hypothetical protein